ncbi:MAG: hypothetical protein GQ564_20415 [Bacteroidales bacterium]|nr:hypothetical protein [Bacteroidales bacterium]
MHIKNRLKNTKRNNILIVLICLISIISCSQEDVYQEDNVIFLNTLLENNIREIGMMKDTLKQGLWIEIDSNRVILNTQFYVNGELSGPFNMYYKNGSPRFESYIKDGEFVGKRTTYYSNGKIKDEGYFKDGKQDSIWTNFTEEGKLDKKIRFKNGKQLEMLIDNNLVPLPPMPPH